MGKRRRAREAAIQYHFWRDLQHGETPERMDDFWEFCPMKPNVREFAQPLIEGMIAHLPEIDERIKRYCENYNLNRISAVDRNVLRLAIYEMLYRDDIPPVVSINEAIAQQFAGKPIDWDELEHALIRADLGVALTTRIIAKLQEREAWSLLGIQDVIKVAREEIAKILPAKAKPLQPISGKPNVILVAGVNGTGKTTSVAKLAHYLKLAAGRVRPNGGQHRHTVLLAAADTFRAAAIEQLGVWADRLGVEMVKGQYGADPAALCYDAYQKAANNKIDFLLCDTAGRLHTKSNLMAELQKVKRTLSKHDTTAPNEILLVVDATTR